MKKNILIFLILISYTTYSQYIYKDSILLTISPNIDKEDLFNKEIIKTFNLFLETKDSSYTSNKYWSKSDFEKYITPYSELGEIGRGRLGKHFYQPSLMEIITTNKENKKIIKVAFIGHNNETKSNLIKAIYNIVATKIDGKIIFSKYLDYATQNWKVLKESSITYKISAFKTINKQEVIRQKKDISKLCLFFNTKPIEIIYYSCITPKEVFELKGFDYHSMMYIDTSGGFSADKDLVLSGNNSEYYTHEIVHIYMRHLFPTIIPFFDEGFATYTGGSGKYNYTWQRDKLKKFLVENPSFKFEEHVKDPYERLYFEHETPIPYMIGALVCERVFRLYGKEKLFELFRSNKDVFDTLKIVGLTKENINNELLKEIELLPTSTIYKNELTIGI